MKIRPLSSITETKNAFHKTDLNNEFSRVINVHTLGVEPQILKFSAMPNEKERLRDRLGILALNRFEIKCQVSHDFLHSRVHIDAMLCAELVQACVLTLAEVKETLSEPVSLKLVTKCAAEDTSGRFFDDGPEEIELNADGTIDMGEIFAQYLSLSMNPYPRAGQSTSN
ncbi:MAG: hypothetical protein H6925_05485 [Holosporaceae bacterium]|nr:MAG: hypothetical protein H6925_05485 [Holosporaceae bacterium]